MWAVALVVLQSLKVLTVLSQNLQTAILAQPF